MSEQQTISKTNEKSARTARAVAAILSQTAMDAALRDLNQTDGRNQSEQASFLAAQSPFLREIYERGGTVVDGVLTVPKEKLSVSPEIEIGTVNTAVKRLTKITGDSAKAKELAPQFVEMGTRIAGSNADGKTRLKIFGWLYRSLEGKQKLLENETAEKTEQEQTENLKARFSEKWQQIVELSESLAALEPKDKLPETSLEALNENQQETTEPDESLAAAEIYENAIETENADRADEIISGESLIAFERIEVGSDLPKIPENLSRSDFEKLLAKAGEIDFQLERGVSVREILAPFRGYIEQTRLDNEFRLVEEEYVKVQTKQIEKDAPADYRFVARREELRELAEDRQTLGELRNQQVNLQKIIQNNFDGSVNREKVEMSMSARQTESGVKNRTDSKVSQKIELTEDETELRRVLIQEKNIEREIDTLSESITEREKGFRPLAELIKEQITSTRRKELTEKVLSLELPVSGILKEKYPELTPQQRNEKLTNSNTFEIQNPAEYLFVRDAAKEHFQILRAREIKNEYRKFDSKNIAENADAKLARGEVVEHQEKIQILKSIEPAFSYKIEGSNRIIKAKPSERAVAGYDFASEYAFYQLKQPETRARFESIVYREYAKRLESAQNSRTLVREAYQIRQENHQAAGVWKNAGKEERRKLQRPLSKNEMTLLFLEQPPKSYTAEMSVLKYNFAHYTEAKQKMTDALEKGNLEPSAEARMLIESLEERLNRRDTETKRKATKHFFESLKTENKKLVIKNEFDHRAAYQTLPPHEKDWIYARATAQKENLEYKIAYRQETKEIGKNQSQNRIVPTSEAATNLRKEFAAGTLWHQAVSLSNRKETKNLARGAGNFDEKLLQTVGFLIHNQSEANNLRVAEWLGEQKSEELKTAVEILNTFARATSETKNNRLTVSVKINESERVSFADYKNLFERYFPADFEKLKEFCVKDNEKFRIEQSRRDGQAALLNDWEQKAQTAVYRTDAPVSVFENERRELEEIDKIKEAQTQCRRAVEVKNAVLAKYEEKLKNELAKSKVAAAKDDLRTAVENAFAPQKSGTLSAEQTTIFERAQDKILISDFERFSLNSTQLEKGLDQINQSFETIAALRLENAKYIVESEKTEEIESLQKQYEAAQQKSQVEIISAVARENYLSKTTDADKTPATIAQNVSNEEQEKARIESHRQARIILEPTQLNEPQQNSETQAKTVEFADALEEAHQAGLRQKPESEISDAFTVAEMKREQFRALLKSEKELNLSPENKPVTLKIYERELIRNKQTITQAKISELIETGKISLADLETKKASEIFSSKEREEIRLEVGERTRENLEPKELWAKRQNFSEKLQQAAIKASDSLERAHEIYHSKDANPKEVSQVFSALDADILTLKNERRTERTATKFVNFKTDFKRDLAQMFTSGQRLENTQLLTAMTKGILLGALEKQNIQPEKIGINSEKLNEISMTIALTMTNEKKREQFANRLFETDKEMKIVEPSDKDIFVHRQTKYENPNHAQTKQFERAR